jgi:hypothetical protein
VDEEQAYVPVPKERLSPLVLSESLSDRDRTRISPGDWDLAGGSRERLPRDATGRYEHEALVQSSLSACPGFSTGGFPGKSPDSALDP